MRNVSERGNPFALVKASDYSDSQINDLWVEIGPDAIDQIIEPHSRISKFIVGSKGSGKTHLLRYHAYHAARLRKPRTSGIDLVKSSGFMAIFHRTTGLDAARFELDDNPRRWQQLFGVYLELRLAEDLLDVLLDIRDSSPSYHFNDFNLIRLLDESLAGASLLHMRNLEDLRTWAGLERRSIDDAVNQAAFTGDLKIRIPFSTGSLLFRLSRALSSWCPQLEDLPVIYLLDEIENFSPRQQQVVNTLIRYGEGLVTFRVSGRLYAVKTLATMSDGEENREGSEFKTSNLDVILRAYTKFSKFAKRFITKRLNAGPGYTSGPEQDGFDIAKCFEELSSENFYESIVVRWRLERAMPEATRSFSDALRMIESGQARPSSNFDEILGTLLNDFPPLLQKLNMLLLCKKHRALSTLDKTAEEIRSEAMKFYQRQTKSGWYATAYGHYSLDLLAQLCRSAPDAPDCVYAGFDSFVKMACGNPRNLLIVLGRVYSIASFRGQNLTEAKKLSLELQTEGAQIAAKFLLDSDSSFGSSSEAARQATARLASVLKVARFSLNIPEVSPLAVSFNGMLLSAEAQKTLQGALNWSFVFEVSEGRPDRNKKERKNTKVQLNPLLSPYWSLPTGLRGDISLSPELSNAIFNVGARAEFEQLLKALQQKWNQPFRKGRQALLEQAPLFE